MRTPVVHSRRLAAEGLLVVATLIWGGTFAVTRAGLGFVSPTLIIAIRFLGAFAVVGPILALAGHRWWRRPAASALLGVVLAGGYILQTVGLVWTTSARSAFVTYLFVVLVPPMQRWLTRKPLTRANLTGLAIVVAGAVVMTSPWAASGWNIGDILTLGSAVCFALFIVLVDRLSYDRSPVDLVPGQFLVAGVIALAAALVGPAVGAPIRFEPVATAWVALGYLTLLGTVGALGLQTAFQARTTPVRATTIYALEPVFAAIFGVTLLHESLRWWEAAGGAIIIAGVLFSEFTPGAASGEPRTPGG